MACMRAQAHARMRAAVHQHFVESCGQGSAVIDRREMPYKRVLAYYSLDFGAYFDFPICVVAFFALRVTFLCLVLGCCAADNHEASF